MTVLWSVDPTSEDAANAQVDLVGTVANVTYRLVDMDLTPPDIEPMYAANADTEGDPFIDSRFRNRTISLGFIATATTDAALQTGIQSLQQKLEKLRREGGTLKMTTPAGTAAVGDVLFASFKPTFEPQLYSTSNHGLRYTLDFECKPFFRGAPVQLSDHAETTLPVAIGVDTSVGGDLAATVKILVDEDQAANQWWMVWGSQSRYYDSASSAALFYEAEGRTLMGGSAAIVTQTGSSGGGTNNAIEATLDSDFQSILSTQAASAGAHLSHVGNFRVFARFLTPTANTGAVSVALNWGEGDFLTSTVNPQVDFPVDAWDNTFRLVDLGQVHLSKAAAGTQRWEGRFLAKSTVVGDKVRIDHFFLVPIDEGSGEASGVVRQQVPSTFTGRDFFTATTAGNALNGRTAPTGGTWATSGDATDFLFSDDVTGSRTEPLRRITGVAGTTGRFAILGSATPTAVQVQAAVRNAASVVGHNLALSSGESLEQGVVARWIDASNYVRATFYRNVTGSGPTLAYNNQLFICQVLAGAVMPLGYVTLTALPPGGANAITLDTWFVLKFAVTTAGQATATLWDDAGAVLLGQLDVTSTALATGGTLASGKSGLIDLLTGTQPITRYYSAFSVFVPTADAALFASQSLELRSDRVVREDSGGTLWQRPSSYEGDYPKFPAAGKESRSVRTIVKACRNDPVTGSDSAIDDLSFRATVTPRYLVLPS